MAGLLQKMVQNLVWATGYNLIAIPAAAGMFIHWKIDERGSDGDESLDDYCGTQRAASASPETPT
jgi:hypothetical protein